MKIIRRKMGESRWNNACAADYRHTMTVFGGVPAAAGLVTLSASAPLYAGREDHRLKVVDEGFLWLQLAPQDGAWWLTAMYDENAALVEFYFDVTAGNYVLSDGESWFDDLFVDVVITPGEKPRIVDADELEAARQEGLISDAQAENALRQARDICAQFADTAALERFCADLLQELRG